MAKVLQAVVTARVADQVVWWMGERKKKLVGLRHETMSVNPFLIPLVFGIHAFKTFDDLAEALVVAHLFTGYATGFGKLVDEKILPQVFGTVKLDKATRARTPILKKSEFDEIDHIIPPYDGQGRKLLSLKAGRWTIQLTMAVQLNQAFDDLIKLRTSGKLGTLTFDEIAVGVFYGTQGTLTDKYDIVRGINRGANHDVKDLQNEVNVYAGREFWAWLNGGERATQDWVLDGILQGVDRAEKTIGSLSDLLAGFRKEFSKQFATHVSADGKIDWSGIICSING